ncbi:adenosine deaminase [Rothia aerolata]|uniref:adenosine deaminase n=1 Tax=Rothia aerolata TaxID=1812262 RepID=A0A917MV99_9MICC|nr:adenosine deaminase [Rothia aerolata]GGH62684.1 adenosine deaminase 2 [Rothia aerolata]
MSTTQDFSWIQRLPKVSLHDHLDGGLQPATVVEIAGEIGHKLPADSAEELAAWFAEAADSRSLEKYLETFEHTLAVMQRAEDLRRVAREHVLTLAGDGVVYGEVRWAPEQHTAAGLTMEQAIEAVADGLHDGMEFIAHNGGRVLVNQIICAMRQNDRSLEVAQLAVKYRRIGVVGFDLAGPEDGFPASKHRAALDYVAEHFLPVTLHAGEAAGLESIRSALLDGRALRLGHGVRITEDFRYTTVGEIDPEGKLMPGADPAQPILQLGEAASWVKDRRITLEVCPHSNLQTDAAYAVSEGKPSTEEWARTYEQHPVAALREAGFSVAISPDNRLMSSTSITREFADLAKNFGYGAADFFELTVNAVEGAFVSMEEKQMLLRSIQGPYTQAIEAEAQAAQGGVSA